MSTFTKTIFTPPPAPAGKPRPRFALTNLTRRDVRVLAFSLSHAYVGNEKYSEAQSDLYNTVEAWDDGRVE